MPQENTTPLTVKRSKLGTLVSRAASEQWLDLTLIPESYWRDDLRDLSGSNIFIVDSPISIAGAELISGELPQLRSLNLRGNRIGPGGVRYIADRLRQLRSLNLEHNQFGQDGAWRIANNLTQLQSLQISFNNIGPDGTRRIAETLLELRSLGLGTTATDNDGAWHIARRLKKLQYLNLFQNHIHRDGAKYIIDTLSDLRELDLSGNNIGEPFDATTDAFVIREYLASATSVLPEIKLAIVGHGRVGKSFLRQRLVGEAYNNKEQSTHNIIRQEMILNPMPSSDLALDALLRTVKAHVFDFGGQEELLSAHRFFITDRRTVYLLVCKAWETPEANNLTYWLRYLAFYAPGSPVVLVISQCDEMGKKRQMPLRNELELVIDEALEGLDERHLQGWVTVVDDVAAGDNPKNIRRVKEAVERAVGRLDSLKIQFPPALIAVKKQLDDDFSCNPLLTREEAQRLEESYSLLPEENPLEAINADGQPRLMKHWLNFKEGFAKLCISAGEDRIELHKIFADVLHALGVVHCLRHQLALRGEQDRRLYDRVMSPQWVKFPVYRVIRDRVMSEHATLPGVMTDRDLDRVMGPVVPDPEERRDLRTLMRLCGLTAEIPLPAQHAGQTQADLVIDHLRDPTPGYGLIPKSWENERIAMTGQFPVLLPKDLLPRLIGHWYTFRDEDILPTRRSFACRIPCSGDQVHAFFHADVFRRNLHVRLKDYKALDDPSEALALIRMQVNALLRPEIESAALHHIGDKPKKIPLDDMLRAQATPADPWVEWEIHNPRISPELAAQLARIDAEVPVLDIANVTEWKTTKQKAAVAGIKVASLQQMRSKGIKSDCGSYGEDANGRKWRKSQENGKIYYFR